MRTTESEAVYLFTLIPLISECQENVNLSDCMGILAGQSLIWWLDICIFPFSSPIGITILK